MKVLGTILLRVTQLCWDWMDCTGLCKTFTIEDCTELQQDCLDWMRIVTDSWPCNRHLNPTNPITIDKILTKSNFLINVNVVRFRDFSGSVYAHFPKWTWETCSAVNSSQLDITCAPPPPPPHGRCEAPPVSFFLQFGHWQDIGTAAAWTPPPRWPDFIVTTL